MYLVEPTSGLDPLGRLLVRDIIAELRARGTTVFLNSHLLGEVEATCDRVAFVKQGRVVRELSLASGSAAASLDVELRLAPMDDGVLRGLAARGSDVQRVGADRVRLRASDETAVASIVSWLVGQGISVFAVESRRKSLETWFVEVMGDDQRPG